MCLDLSIFDLKATAENSCDLCCRLEVKQQCQVKACMRKTFHLARKYAWTFVRGNFILREPISFRERFSKDLRASRNRLKDIYPSFLGFKAGFCVYYASCTFLNTKKFEN